MRCCARRTTGAYSVVLGPAVELRVSGYENTVLHTPLHRRPLHAKCPSLSASIPMPGACEGHAAHLARSCPPSIKCCLNLMTEAPHVPLDRAVVASRRFPWLAGSAAGHVEAPHQAPPAGRAAAPADRELLWQALAALHSVYEVISRRITRSHSPSA